MEPLAGQSRRRKLIDFLKEAAISSATRQRFPAAEINSSFYWPHGASTYERWAASVPADFRFAMKIPRAVTHIRRLANTAEPLARFLDEASLLGPKLGPLLIQLPPSLVFHQDLVTEFLKHLGNSFASNLACEPCMKQLVRPGLRFDSLWTTRRTLTGYEVMTMVRQGQVRRICGRDIRAQAAFVPGLFDIPA